MFCSTIIPTIGRPSLERAVRSVLDQEFTDADFEIIVVNDSGKPLADAAWQHSERVTVIQTNRHERSFARNTGAAVAKGKFLHFLDDDDWLLPGALQSFWNVARRTNAGWLYGSSQLVDRAGHQLIQLHHALNGNCFVQVMAGEWIPLQASLIEATTFFSIGGFNHRLTGPEDIDLYRRIALTRDISGTDSLVACIEMGTEGSTTNYNRSLVDSRWARESILNETGVFTRLRDSADSSYWHGRIVRTYVTSAVWNMKRRRVTTAASRTAFGVAGMILAGNHLLTHDFWSAILHSYESPTFLRGFQEAGLPVQRREYNKAGSNL